MSEKETDPQLATEAPVLDPALKKAAFKNATLYGVARIALLIVLTIIIEGLALLIGISVPLVIALALALILALPLSMFVFKNLRIKAVDAMAQWSGQRKAYKEWVRSELANR